MLKGHAEGSIPHEWGTSMRFQEADVADGSGRRHPKRGLFLLFIVVVAVVANLAVRSWPASEVGLFLGDKVDHYLDPQGTARIDDMMAEGNGFEPRRHPAFVPRHDRSQLVGWGKGGPACLTG